MECTQCFQSCQLPSQHPPGWQRLWGRGSPREAKELSLRVLGAPRGGARSSTPSTPASAWLCTLARSLTPWGLSVPPVKWGSTGSPECVEPPRRLGLGWGLRVMKPCRTFRQRFPLGLPAGAYSAQGGALGDSSEKQCGVKARGSLGRALGQGPREGHVLNLWERKNKNVFFGDRGMMSMEPRPPLPTLQAAPPPTRPRHIVAPRA